MINETKSETEEQMDKTILSLEKKLQRIRTGRANPSLLESVEVDYYGSKTPISQMSNISVEDARTLSINYVVNNDSSSTTNLIYLLNI